MTTTDVKWPDHEWAGDEYGHACSGCHEASSWYCDKVAHALGEHNSGLRLLRAIANRDPSARPDALGVDE